LTALEAHFDRSGIAHRLRAGEQPRPGDVLVSAERGGWTTVTWPAYFVPPDLSADLGTIVSTITTTDHEGWSHFLFGAGTLLDSFHSYPQALGWDAAEVATMARDWAGDFELVARVVGVPAGEVRRHFCQATTATRDHPGRERLGYLALWRALGIRVAEGPPYAALAVVTAWHRVLA
jgi:hypothetical protein